MVDLQHIHDNAEDIKYQFRDIARRAEELEHNLRVYNGLISDDVVQEIYYDIDMLVRDFYDLHREYNELFEEIKDVYYNIDENIYDNAKGGDN